MGLTNRELFAAIWREYVNIGCRSWCRRILDASVILAVPLEYMTGHLLHRACHSGRTGRRDGTFCNGAAGPVGPLAVKIGCWCWCGHGDALAVLANAQSRGTCFHWTGLTGRAGWTTGNCTFRALRTTGCRCRTYENGITRSLDTLDLLIVTAHSGCWRGRRRRLRITTRHVRSTQCHPAVIFAYLFRCERNGDLCAR